RADRVGARDRPPGREVREPRQVAPISLDRRRGQLPLHPQVVEELLDPQVQARRHAPMLDPTRRRGKFSLLRANEDSLIARVGAGDLGVFAATAGLPVRPGERPDSPATATPAPPRPTDTAADGATWVRSARDLDGGAQDLVAAGLPVRPGERPDSPATATPAPPRPTDTAADGATRVRSARDLDGGAQDLVAAG